ncbi:MAG: PBP1A family penicillin-binding protein [Acidobacteria bacterium]|nr:PBP1A family penicillin-binding protein [Acidobacteriota bacterium]
MNERTLRLLTRLVWAAVAGCLAGALLGWGLAQMLHIPQVDKITSYTPSSTTTVMADDGTPLANFSVQRRIVLRPEEIPNSLKLAIVATEDADFYHHGGIDPAAIFRAVVYSILKGRLGARGGASTLTQQLARTYFGMHQRTIKRKLKEMLLAIDIEKRMSKDQILTLYANMVYLGQGAYGVEAASRLYFGKSARDLDLAQAALLAGMIQNPERRWSPIRNPSGATHRRNYVLKRMLDLRFITPQAYQAAIREPLGVSLHKQRIDTGAYFVETIRQRLEKSYGTDALYSGGLQVTTTLDPTLQRAAERAVREGLVKLDMSLGYRRPENVIADGRATSPDAYSPPSWNDLELEPGAMVEGVVTKVSRRRATFRIASRTARLDLAGAAWTHTTSLRRILRPGDVTLVRLPTTVPEDPKKPIPVTLLQIPSIEAALVAMDNRTGDIRAMVGGFDFHTSEFNRAIQAKRQCGSAFKPFVYLTAFQQGYTPADTLFDAPFLLPDATGKLTYCPKNYHGEYHGITTLRRALELSFNATAVKLEQLVGPRNVIKTARKFGITTPLHPYATLALGAFEVRLIDLVRAYAGFANLGVTPKPIMITEVKNLDGKVLERNFPDLEPAMPPPVTYLLVHVLQGVVLEGTGQAAASLDAHLAGKTGTTNAYTDAWFVGFSPRLTVGVWVGRDLKKTIANRMTGARAALPIWMSFMKTYLDALDPQTRKEDFPVPAGVVFTPVDWYTGLRAIPSCPKVILEAFLDGTEPTESCSKKRHELVKLPWPFQEPFYTPRPGEPMPTPDAVEIANERLAQKQTLIH